MSLSFVMRRITGRRRSICNLMLLTLLIFLVSSVYLIADRVSPSDADLVADDVMVVIRDSADQKEYIDKKGIHVIVGQFSPNAFEWSGSPNLTKDILNSNNYNPIPKAGEFGLPVYIPTFEQNKMKTLFHVNKFNIMASDRISVNRSLPDPRKESCRRKMYDVKELPNASVIIVFHNEAWSTLLRTVHSVLNRTPKKILKEIILVDDASERTFLKIDLPVYVNKLNSYNVVPIKLLRSMNRTGLIRSRLLGAKVAKAKILVFLDAHVEATIGWMEPLLARVGEDPTRVVSPVIDVIHDETFAYAKSFELHWGGFNWNLHFRWFPLSQHEMLTHMIPGMKGSKNRRDETDPFKTPVMAGGLFAIDKDFFYSVGSYDNEMDIWGGENIEMSLRIWTCGGRLEISPCSHVAHVFRKSSPYTFRRDKGVAGVLYENLARVAEVWMDDYKDFFYAMNPLAKAAAKGIHPESLVGRKLLRETLKCKPFQWFLDEVWPENFFPSPNRFFGQIKSLKSNECIQRPNGKGIGGPVGHIDMERCSIEPYSPQSFVYTKKGYIMSDDSVCFDASDSAKEGTPVLVLACSELSRQKWKFDPDLKTLSHYSTGLCLTLDSKSDKTISLRECIDNKTSQKWNMIQSEWKSST